VYRVVSTFLIGTLPNALMAPDPAGALALASVSTQADDERGALVAVRQALDVDAAAELRCRALDELDEKGLTLDPFLLRQFLADQDATVARYALGLISLSSERSSLLEEAAATPHASDPAFRDDLQLLREMLE